MFWEASPVVHTASVSIDTALPEGAAITAKFDHRGRLHCAAGPAAEVSTGDVQYYWHGVQVPDFVVLEPSKITVEMIETATNTELRRVLMERYGVSRFLLDSGAQPIQEDEAGVLYVKKIFRDELLVMVKVKNSTQELDGSFKDYFLRVPPHTKTAKEGVAWTFQMQAKDYNPQLQT